MSVTEYVEGKTLAQWMNDNPRPDLETVRGIVEQIARGLQAFHRLEMLHQDLRPQNIMIDTMGTVKIIDFGSARVAGVIEASPMGGGNDILGTAQYTAPEYFLDEGGSPRSDLFSLGVIAYQMLTGQLPYGAKVAQARTRAKQRKLAYHSARGTKSRCSAVGRRGARKGPSTPIRTGATKLSPNSSSTYATQGKSSCAPRLDRCWSEYPHLFWKGLSLGLACVILALLAFPIR